MKDFDVIISGSAMTGATLALSLSSLCHHKIKIAIIEKSSPKAESLEGFNARVIALSLGSMQKFAKINTLDNGNLWDLIKDLSNSIDTIYISDQGHFGKSSLKKDEIGVQSLGSVIPLDAVGERFLTQIAKHSNISVFCPDEIISETYEQQSVTVTLASEKQLTAKLLIAADGTWSKIAKNAHIQAQPWYDYGQFAVIANVKTQIDHNNCAFERFTKEGPLALLPMGTNLLSLVWCVKDQHYLMNLSKTEFLTKLQEYFGWQLGKFKATTDRFAFPLICHKAPQHINHRLALVGNAAQLLHPVAGQGFNIAMRDIHCLSHIVSEAFLNDEDFGSFDKLNRYQEIRQKDQQKLLLATKTLVNTFACEFSPVQLTRGVSLQMLHKVPALKRAFTKIPLGW